MIPFARSPFSAVRQPVVDSAEFWLPLADLGAGEASLKLGRGTGAATFTRATAATCRLANGLLKKVASGVPRSHYLADGTYAGYLAEGARTNLCLQSEDLATTWTNNASTETTNVSTAPDGTATADKLEEDGTTGLHYVTQQVAKAASALPFTFSIWLKAAERTWAWFQVSSGVNGYRQWFDLGTGAVGSALIVGAGFTGPVASIESWGSGWYRCVFTVTTDAALTALDLLIGTATGDTVISFLGTVGSGIEVWGAQIEQAAFASSYIPTVAAAVTRNADSLTYPASGNIAAGVGTIYCDADVATGAVQSVAVRTWSYDPGDGLSGVSLELSNGTNVAQMFSGGQGVVNGSALSTTASANISKLAGSWAVNDLAVAVNGAVEGTDATANVPSGLTNAVLRIGGDSVFGAELFGTIKNVRIWQRQLADADLQALTA